MQANEIIRDIVEKNKDLTLSKIAFMIGLKKEQKTVLSQRLRQENISIRNMDEMLRACGYKMVAVPFNTVVKEGWYEIE